jgi:uncharacterized protein YjiK
MKYLLFFLLFIGCSSSDTKQTDDTSDTTDTTHKNTSTIYGKIANFSEASGICYASKSDSLFVACDNGRLYEIDKDGTVLNTKDLSSLKNHDFEGISYDVKNNLILVAVEGSDNILVLNNELVVQHKININRTDSQGRLILEKDKKNGLEAITIKDGKIYLSNQSFKRLPEDDPSVVFTIDLIGQSDANIAEIYDHGYDNISGMDIYNNYLYMVSDTGNLLIKYDYQAKEVLKEFKISRFNSEIKHISVEGVAFDNENNIYFADNKDGHIFKYRFSE